jgi:hypothetical protein
MLLLRDLTADIATRSFPPPIGCLDKPIRVEAVIGPLQLTAKFPDNHLEGWLIYRRFMPQVP